LAPRSPERSPVPPRQALRSPDALGTGAKIHPAVSSDRCNARVVRELRWFMVGRSGTVRWGSGSPCADVFPRPGAALLVAPNRERARRAAPVGPPEREGRARGHLQPRRSGALAGRGEVLRDRLRGEVRQPRREITEDLDTLPAFYDYAAEHGSICEAPTNPIESTFATVRLRTRVTKGPGSRPASLWRSSSASPRKVAGVP
jgi:hypothetical protein